MTENLINPGVLIFFQSFQSASNENRNLQTFSMVKEVPVYKFDTNFINFVWNF